jgi:hypothetical protein
MMKRIFTMLVLSIALVIASIELDAQTGYSNFRTMSQKIDALSKDYPTLCSVKSLVKTTGGKDIWVLSIGTGDKDSKPAVVVTGGTDGSHLLGKELALGFATSLLKESTSSEIKALLDKITFYIFPDVNPDASEQFFSALKYERTINAGSTDDDKDFAYDEDPYEDLNNDGYVSQLRIKDPTGKYVESDEDKRIMVEADLSKGETGGYLLFTEGIDNDKDEKLNEDGQGGVNFNRNFTFNYEEFGLNAGPYPVSEPETKAVADFLFSKFNVYAVFTFGLQDNLGQPYKSADRPNADRRITSIMKSDEVINKLVSDKYHEITGAKGAPLSRTTPGNFMDWAYYHYGRYSFGTPAWWFPAERGKNQEAAFLRFAEKNKINDAFIPWTEISHPDFPGKKAEIGGIKPFALINPPADTLNALISKNYKFITSIAAMHPELEFLDIKTENAGENIFRLTLKVHNKGIFSTCAEVGNINTFTRIMRISLDPTKGQVILSGEKVQRINRLEGDSSTEFSWLITGRGAVKVTAGALNTGIITSTFELK